METQDHKLLNHSAINGHGGAHVCHKCGWSFPNSHPSSRHRRAHKRVCGTIEGFRLDDGARDKTHVDSHVGEFNSVDELKTTTEGGNAMERTISRLSSSGVGSGSSGSIRSDEDVYADATSEISENPATIKRVASDGVMQRFYSLESGNEMDSNEPDGVNPVGTDNLCTSDLLKDNTLQTAQRVDSENDKSKSGVDHSAVVASGSENAVDQNMIQSSEQSKKLDTVSENGEEFASNKDESVPRTSRNETPEDVAEEVFALKRASDELKGVIDKVLESMSADGLLKAILTETDNTENNNERLNDVEIPEKVKPASSSEVNSSGNIDSQALEIPHIDSGNSNLKKSDSIEERNSKFDAVTNNGGQCNFSNERVSSEDIDVCSIVVKQEAGEKYVDVQNTFREPNQTSDANSSKVDVNISRSEIDKDVNNKDSEEEKGEKISDSGDIIVGHLQEESLLTSQRSGEDVESSCQNSAVVNQCPDERVAEETSCNNEGDGVIKHHVRIPTIDAIVDSGSQTGSLDVNWGSFSAMSVTSDAQPSSDSNHPRGSQGEESLSMVLKPVMENQPFPNQVPVKTEVGTEQMERDTDIQTPTVAYVVNGPDRGTKGKEIIDNVTNWNSGKQRTPLKTLLGEAFARSREESPVHDSQTDLTPGTGNVTLKSDNNGTETEAAVEETGKEGDSPAIYAVDIKAEKRRPKNRSYWVPFLCCSSLGASSMAANPTKH
ncbi:hypothetical protein vseg_014346 [Gypsophila vaccaria]